MQLWLCPHGAEAALCAHRWYFAPWWQQFHAAALSSSKQYKSWTEREKKKKKKESARRQSSCSNDCVRVCMSSVCVVPVVIQMSQYTRVDELESWLFVRTIILDSFADTAMQLRVMFVPGSSVFVCNWLFVPLQNFSHSAVCLTTLKYANVLQPYLAV